MKFYTGDRTTSLNLGDRKKGRFSYKRRNVREIQKCRRGVPVGETFHMVVVPVKTLP